MVYLLQIHKNSIMSRLDNIFKHTLEALMRNPQKDGENSRVCQNYKKESINVKSLKHYLEESGDFTDLKVILDKECSTGDSKDLSTFLNNVESDKMWKDLLICIHDMNCSEIDRSLTVPISVGGHTEHLTLTEIERNFFLGFKFRSQVNAPCYQHSG